MARSGDNGVFTSISSLGALSWRQRLLVASGGVVRLWWSLLSRVVEGLVVSLLVSCVSLGCRFVSGENVRFLSFGAVSACDAFRLHYRHVGVVLYSRWCVVFRLSQRQVEV